VPSSGEKGRIGDGTLNNLLLHLAQSQKNNLEGFFWCGANGYSIKQLICPFCFVTKKVIIFLLVIIQALCLQEGFCVLGIKMLIKHVITATFFY